MENLNHNKLQCSTYHVVTTWSSTSYRLQMLEGLLLLKVLISFSSFRGVEITHEGESIQLVNPFEIMAKDAVPMEVRLCSLYPLIAPVVQTSR